MALWEPHIRDSIRHFRQSQFSNHIHDGLSIGGLEGLGSSGPSERLAGTDTQNHEVSLNIQHEFANGMKLSSVTGFSEYEYKDGIEADFLPVEFIGRSDDSEFDQLSQELRLESSMDGAFSWVIGANYIESTQEIDRLVSVDGTFGQPQIVAALTGGLPTILAYSPAQLAGIAAAFGLPPQALPPGVEGLTMWSRIGRLSRWVQDTDSWAVFAQGSWDITPALTLTAGVRYTEETKKADAQTWLNSTAQAWIQRLLIRKPPWSPLSQISETSFSKSFRERFLILMRIILWMSETQIS